MTEQDPWEAAQTYTREQDVRRGDWPTLRAAKCLTRRGRARTMTGFPDSLLSRDLG